MYADKCIAKSTASIIDTKSTCMKALNMRADFNSIVRLADREYILFFMIQNN